ncbi:MAG: hypothetical protein Q8940_16890, partial [Bacteroidota bacterium]|nr:hypothetical protein [Bacteroidota bacterium]
MKAFFTLFLIVITSFSLTAQSIVKSNNNKLAKNSSTKFKAYVIVNSIEKDLENIGLQQASFEEKIKDAVASEGIQIIPIADMEKHGEYYLYIYVSLKDSLKINTKSYSGGVGNSMIEGIYPNKSYTYKDVSDITSSVKKYIRDYIKKVKAPNV